MNKRICIVNVIGDQQVMIDSEIIFDVKFKIDPNINVIQWYGDHGEIEYDDERVNKKITDLTPFLSILDKAEQKKVIDIAMDEARVEDEARALQASIDAMTYADWRATEYPTVVEQLEALYDARVYKDDTKLKEADAKIEAVKLKYPKDDFIPIDDKKVE